MSSPGVVRVWRPGREVAVAAMLGQQRRGGGDPTHLRDRRGRLWRASRTPEGPVGMTVAPQDEAGDIRAEAWGPGAEWAIEQLPDLFGESDDWGGFEPRHPLLEEIRNRMPHLRLGRTGLVLEALVPTIIEQKVTGQEAFAGFRALVRRHGEPAPGPGGDAGLMLQPSADALRAIPSWEWLRLHIDPARSRTILEVARHESAWLRLASVGPDELDRRIRSVRGIGIWTSAEVRQRALGDRDAVSFGDYHVARDVGWALTGEEFDDGALAAYLEPWRPQRGRVPQLLNAAGIHRPRHGPRMAPRGHFPARDQIA